MATRKRQPKTALKLDLAAGQNRREGFLGVDVVKGDGVDYVLDLERDEWPWDEDSIDELHCSHFVEHVHDFCAFMDNAWRVAKDGATFTIVCPYYSSIRAWQDPTHVRAINEITFYYFNAEWRAAQRLDHYPVECDWEVVSVVAAWNEPWNLKSEEAQQFAMRHYLNCISDLTVILRARKGGS